MHTDNADETADPPDRSGTTPIGVRRSRLDEIGLAPPHRNASISPAPVRHDAALRDRYRGAILGTAIGDALGRPAEGRTAEEIRTHYGRLTDFLPWRDRTDGPRGTWTDDTQMTVCVAETLLGADGRIDPVDLAGRLSDWLPGARGAGGTCVAAVRALRDGVSWWESGVDSAGNGAAMRAAPIGLVHHDDFESLRLDAAVSAVITHAHPMAVVSAVAHAWIVGRLVAMPTGTLDPVTLIAELCAAIDDLVDPGEVEREWRSRGRDGHPVRLVERLAELPGLLAGDPESVASELYCGAFVLESLPMALWHFLAAPQDPERAVTAAVATGHDADTVASMTGAYIGAYHGANAFPERWRGSELEDVDRLVELADRLFALGGS